MAYGNYCLLHLSANIMMKNILITNDKAHEARITGYYGLHPTSVTCRLWFPMLYISLNFNVPVKRSLYEFKVNTFSLSLLTEGL